MSFLVVENLDDADQFILGRDFVRNFDVMIDLNNGLIRIRNPDRKYVKKPINRIIADENKVPIFLDRKVKLQPGQAVVAIFRMRNLNSLSDSKQVCLVPNPNSQSSVILGRSFSVTRNGLCVSVLLNWVYGPYQVMLNVDGISNYTRTYVTTDDDQMGQIYLGEEELRVRRIGHDAMMGKTWERTGFTREDLIPTNFRLLEFG